MFFASKLAPTISQALCAVTDTRAKLLWEILCCESNVFSERVVIAGATIEEEMVGDSEQLARKNDRGLDARAAFFEKRAGAEMFQI